MTIVEFLLARLAEDEADQGSPRSDWHKGWCDLFSYDPTSCDCGLVVRVLADVEAKRAQIAQTFRYEAKIDGEWGCCHSADEIQAGHCLATPVNEIAMLRLLALPYADHADYQLEWQPEIHA